MQFIRLSDMAYPLYEGDIRIEHPEIADDQTGDTFPCPENYAKVHEVPEHDINRETHICYPTAPECRDGIWYATWGIREKTTIEKIRSAQNEATDENYYLNMEMDIATRTLAVAGIPDKQRQAWQQYLDEANAYINSYPRSGNTPRLPLAASDPNRNTDINAPGVSPDVIG